MAISNIMASTAKGALVTVAAPGQAQFDYGAAGGSLYYLLLNTTGAQIADATKEGWTVETSFNTNELTTANGYTVRGMGPGSQAVTVSGAVPQVLKVTSAAATWTATSGGISAYGVALVGHAGTAAGSPFLLYYDFSGTGTGVVTAVSAVLTVTPAAAGLYTIT